MPFEIDPITRAPSKADQTEPRPPKRLVPAITGPAIANSSRSLPPELWLTASNREAARMLGRALREGGPPPADPADAVEVLDVLDAARRSAAEREVVPLSG
jgi:predicted dehydrogenase